MASKLTKQTSTITIIPIQSHVKRNKIPPQLKKRIEKQIKLCDNKFNHTITWKDWKSEMKLKKNIIDDEYEIDEKTINQASNYNALIVGSPNYNQQYPHIAYQNISNIFNTIHRRMQRKQWDISQSLCKEMGINILTPISFHDQLLSQNKKIPKHQKRKHIETTMNPVEFLQQELPQSLINLKDGSGRDEMPYFESNEGVQVLLYRDIVGNVQSRHRIKKIISYFEPESIITQYNAKNFHQFRDARFNSFAYSLRRRMNSCIQFINPDYVPGNPESDAVSSMMEQLMINKNNDISTNVIAGGICDDYHELLYRYSYLCDLFSMSSIEISPIFPIKILPKKVKIITKKLLKPNNKLTSEMRYLIYPYFFPHLYLYGQIRNSYLMHCLYGSIKNLKSKRILMIINDENVYDLMTKLKSNDLNGYFFKYSYNELFKEVNKEFVTMPSTLPSMHILDSNLKLKDFEWKRLHSMLGLKFVQFLEHEMEMKQALVI